MTEPALHPCQLRPVPDRHSHRIVTAAIADLGVARLLDPDHPTVRLHLVASLLQQTETSLSRAVADLARRGYNRNQIAILLGLS